MVSFFKKSKRKINHDRPQAKLAFVSCFSAIFILFLFLALTRTSHTLLCLPLKKSSQYPVVFQALDLIIKTPDYSRYGFSTNLYYH